MKKYLFEFLSILIAVLTAFGLNSWNDHRRDQIAQDKILMEMYNGLMQDVEDVGVNIVGHKSGMRACDSLLKIIDSGSIVQDSFEKVYFMLTRSFISIQNRSAYEALKSKGLELIKDDMVRKGIIKLYEYDLDLMKALEEEYGEMQFHTHYFHKINDLLAPHLIFNQRGRIAGIKTPIRISEADRQLLRSYVWRMKLNRSFALGYYAEQEEKINTLRDLIHGYIHD